MATFGPKLTARDRTRLSLGAGKGKRVKTSEGVWVQLDTDPVLLAVLDGLAAAGRHILETTKPPDAEPFGVGLVTSGGMAGYAFGKVAHVEGADRSVKKPRAFRASKEGVDVIVGYPFPARFNETGTADQPARPFLGPALMAAADDIPGILRDNFPKDGP